jgi:hypothetical protein
MNDSALAMVENDGLQAMGWTPPDGIDVPE